MPTNEKKKRTPKATADDLIRVALSASHWKRDCAECGEDCSRVALVEIAYTFESCACKVAPYAHLAERLHHIGCLVRIAPESRHD